MAQGYAFSGEKARALQGVVRERIKDGLAELVANGSSVKDAGDFLGITRGQAARAWAQIKADCGSQAV